MNDTSWMTIAFALSGACVLAVLFTRAGSDRRRVRKMMGWGAALGGVSLLLLSMQ